MKHNHSCLMAVGIVMVLYGFVSLAFQLLNVTLLLVLSNPLFYFTASASFSAYTYWLWPLLLLIIGAELAVLGKKLH